MPLRGSPLEVSTGLTAARLAQMLLAGHVLTRVASAGAVDLGDCVYHREP